ncbi:MAG: extracellular solute-binding protein [Lachnospiraceae bacterium]|nr:extracellular solute-binding protein [Lachnospiraceae bacterium]MDD3660073.1 extracellular solute-binding protein [Lachnospiraceae bacterium]
MKRKSIALLLAAVLSLSLMGCGAKQEAAQPAAEETTEAATDEASAEEAPAAEASADSNTLTVWCWDPAFNIYAMEQAAEVYKEKNPDFVLNVVETPWADIQTKLTTAATSSDLSSLPDIMLLQDNAFQKNVISYPDAFTDISGSGIAFDQFGGAKLAYSTVDGKNYGVPFDNGAVISCVRTDVLEKAGYTVDDFTDITWSKYIEIGKDVLAKTGTPMLSMQAGETDLIMMMLQSAGGSLFDAEGNPTIVNNAVLAEVMGVYQELIKSGVLIEVNDWDQYIGTLTNSTVAGTINGCWILASIQTAADQSGKWAITNMPKLETVDGATNYSNNGGSSWVVTSNCKNVDLATDFLGSTFAGSVEFYEKILPSSGALATYLPAADSAVYGEPQAFFNDQTIYALITEFAGKVPSNNTGVYYYEARDAVATALTNVVNGADITSELQAAEDTVKFQMGQ